MMSLSMCPMNSSKIVINRLVVPVNILLPCTKLEKLRQTHKFKNINTCDGIKPRNFTHVTYIG